MNRIITALSLVSLFAAAPAFAKSTVAKPAVTRADKAEGGDAKPAEAKPAKKPKKTTKKTEKTEAARKLRPPSSSRSQ